MLSITTTESAPSPAQRRAARALSVALTHPAAVYLASVAEGSRYTLTQSVRQAASFFGSTAAILEWTSLTYAHVSALRSYLSDTYAPATGNKVLCAVRGVLKHAVRLGLMDRMAMQAAIDVPPIRGHREQPGRSLALAETEAMVRACDTRGVVGIRDRALLALTCGAGLRRIDAATLNVESLRPDGDLLVRGKGNKERLVPLGEPVRRALDAWIAARGSPFGPLFVRITRGGKVSSERLTPDGITYALHELRDAAGLAHFTPHDLRRTFIGDMFDAGVDVRTIQEIVGHTCADTTARYDRRPQRVRRAAVARLTFPF
jgi:site-specific recombinase XerD